MVDAATVAVNVRANGARRASAEMKGFSNSIKGVGTELKSATSAFSAFGGAVGVIGGAVAAGAVIGGFKSVISSASNLTESINAVQVVFGDASETILEFGKTASETSGLAASEFNQLSALTGSLLLQMGNDSQEAARQTTLLAQRAADMASVFNTDVKDSLFAINAALRGETEPIRRFAVDVTDATIQAFALSQGIDKTVSSMSQQEKGMLRLQSIFQQTDRVEGDFVETSGDLANATRILQTSFENLKAELGAEFTPAAADAVIVLRDMVRVMGDLKQAQDDFQGTRVGGALGAYLDFFKSGGAAGSGVRLVRDTLEEINQGFNPLADPDTRAIDAMERFIVLARDFQRFGDFQNPIEQLTKAPTFQIDHNLPDALVRLYDPKSGRFITMMRETAREAGRVLTDELGVNTELAAALGRTPQMRGGLVGGFDPGTERAQVFALNEFLENAEAAREWRDALVILRENGVDPLGLSFAELIATANDIEARAKFVFAELFEDMAILIDNTDELAARNLEAANSANELRIAQDAVTMSLRGQISARELAKTLPTPFGLDPTGGEGPNDPLSSQLLAGGGHVITQRELELLRISQAAEGGTFNQIAGGRANVFISEGTGNTFVVNIDGETLQQSTGEAASQGNK